MEHPMTDEERRRASVRSMTREYVRRDLLLLQNECARCESVIHVQRHHPEPMDAMTIMELCERCHRGFHTGKVSLEGVPLVARNPNPQPTACSCGQPTRPGQRLCLACHRAYMRRYRMEKKARENPGETVLQAGSKQELECDQFWAALSPDSKELVRVMIESKEEVAA
jgi:hypothetical protein